MAPRAPREKTDMRREVDSCGDSDGEDPKGRGISIILVNKVITEDLLVLL